MSKGMVVVVGTVLISIGLAAVAKKSQGGDEDAVPFFRPDPPLAVAVMYGPPRADPHASECAIDDRPCLDTHDVGALAAALAKQNELPCDGSGHPDNCRAAYEMITGTVGMSADPILDDPCSWVVLVDHGIATIHSQRTGVVRRYADRGWKPMTFLGKCDLSTLLVHDADDTVPLPAWVALRPRAKPGSWSPPVTRPSRLAVPAAHPALAPDANSAVPPPAAAPPVAPEPAAVPAPPPAPAASSAPEPTPKASAPALLFPAGPVY